MTGGQVMEALKKSAGARGEAHGEKIIESGGIEACRDTGQCKETLGFRGKCEAFIDRSPDQRRDAHAIPAEHQGTFPIVPDSKRKLSFKMLHNIDVPSSVSMNDDFDIALRFEPGTAGFEFLSQGDVVVDFAVGDQDELIVDHRLLTPGGIHERKTMHAESCALSSPEVSAVGTPMTHGVQHGVGVL